VAVNANFDVDAGRREHSNRETNSLGTSPHTSGGLYESFRIMVAVLDVRNTVSQGMQSRSAVSDLRIDSAFF
jgi:hypothetical protein